MKRFLWLGMFFLSASWLYSLPIFVPTNWIYTSLFLIFGIFFTTIGLFTKKHQQIEKKYLIFILPIILSIFIIPYPFNIGPVIITIGSIAYIIASYILNYNKLVWMYKGLFLSGLILIFQSIIFPFYATFSSIFHRIDFLSQFCASLGKIFGINTTVNNGIIYISTSTQFYSFIVSLENLGFYLWLNILIGSLLLFFFMEKKREIVINILVFFLLSAIFLILRYITLVLISAELDDFTIFWKPYILFISYLPFILLLIKVFPLKKWRYDFSDFKNFVITRKKIMGFIISFSFIFLAIGAYTFQDAGNKKEGRILIDELHSDWESTLQKMDKEWYGRTSVYNYYSLSEWLKNYYDVNKNINHTINDSLLEKYDILILKCPTSSYSTDEVTSIKKFVKNGGGLFLIGDHTNVFGMNTYLNKVANEFGITFNFDSTYDLETGSWSIYQPSHLLRHPIVYNMDKFYYLTSCSLKAPIWSEPVMIGYSLQSSQGSYATRDFFPEGHALSDSEYGLFLQSVALKYGKGRIVAFTDSTCFSNYCIFMDGYTGYILGTIEYLNRSNHLDIFNQVFFILAMGFCILTIYFLRKEKKAQLLLFVVSVGLLAFCVSNPLFMAINKENYVSPSSNLELTNVCFINEHSDFVISSHPIMEEIQQKKCYDTFFVWTQRIGYIPSIENRLHDALEKGDICVIINPVKSFAKTDISAIKNYIDKGGSILIMDSIINQESTINELLSHFGMKVIIESKFNGTKNINNRFIGGIIMPALKISGGNSVLKDEEDRIMLSVYETENGGKVVVFVDSYTFSNEMMGSTFTVPDEFQQRVYDTEYYIFEEILLKQ